MESRVVSLEEAVTELDPPLYTAESALLVVTGIGSANNIKFKQVPNFIRNYHVGQILVDTVSLWL